MEHITRSDIQPSFALIMASIETLACETDHWSQVRCAPPAYYHWLSVVLLVVLFACPVLSAAATGAR